LFSKIACIIIKPKHLEERATLQHLSTLLLLSAGDLVSWQV